MASKLAVVALVMVGLTFSLWTVAMFTPGWLVISITDETYPQGMEGSFSIFYYRMCAASICKTGSLSSSQEGDSSNQIAKMPHFVEIQMEACFALILCGAGFIVLLINMKSVLPQSSRIVTGGILILLGVASESTLVGRMIDANIKVNNAFNVLLEMTSSGLLSYREDYRLGIQYSIIVASLGVITGIFSCLVVISLYCRNRNSSAEDHQVLEVYPSAADNY
ncbi:uncharacterized protein LOC125674238 [Ostrea edulis]|uniref:uncharacterized protein LOC125674238 n=1 Tax=Ostrea edulis TaxID=37623 RepID=UPI002094EF3A|nr:uncharacterized protein LOC125674238 [Ostrea edulis]